MYMKIGVFDSGLGGLAIMQAVSKELPEYSYCYLGDTLHVPYGDRTQEDIYRLTLQAVDYLFRVQDCALIILACNSASADALHKLQTEYLPVHYPNRRILGVIIPTVEAAVSHNNIRSLALIATNATVQSGAYQRELQKLNPTIALRQLATPSLVPLIESGNTAQLERELQNYLLPLIDTGIDGIILACTHYSLIKTIVANIVGASIKVISQDEILPSKLQTYVLQHPELAARLTKQSQRTYLVTDHHPQLLQASQLFFPQPIAFQAVSVD